MISELVRWVGVRMADLHNERRLRRRVGRGSSVERVSFYGVEMLEPRLLMHAGHTETDPQPPTTGGTTGTTTGPHPDDPAKRDEHLALLELVSYDDVTNRAVHDGAWSDPLTWELGLIPDEHAHVLVPDNITVTFDVDMVEPIHTLRIDGALTFDTTHDTFLWVDTMVVDPRGELWIGTPEHPVPTNVQATIGIADLGEIDQEWDPLQLSRGLISHGRVEIWGAETTSFLTLAAPAAKGATTLTLAQVPTNWQVGDRIILTGTYQWKSQDEELEIKGINGNVVTVDKLKYAHASPGAGLDVYVANVSRNVVIVSENPAETDRRGHVMFMHSDDVQVHNVGFYGLGRTDKRNPENDPLFDDAGELIPNTGLNPRGRYAVHFHRTGTGDADHPAVVTGSAVVDSPGWGFVNHDSNVLMQDNVAFDVVGAAFVTENGNEIGAIRHNIAIKSEGSGDGLEDREDINDFGHGGHGFWMQGGGVAVENNVAVSQADAAFIFFTRSELAEFDAKNLWDPTIANGRLTVPVGEVPIRSFKGNVALTSRTGVETWFHLLDAKHAVRSVIADFTAWNVRNQAVRNPYTNQTTLRNVRAIGDMAKFKGVAIDGNDVTRNMRYESLNLAGWEVGLKMPFNGQNVVQDGTFNNVISILIPKSQSQKRVIDLNGDPQFAGPSAAILGTRTHYDIYLDAKLNIKDNDITKLFTPDIIQMGTVRMDGKQLYFLEQAANFVPFKAGEAAAYVPAELVGKTNQQLWDQYGLALGGAIAPAGATTDPSVRGLIGNPVTYLPELKLLSKKYSSVLETYQLVYQNAQGQKVKDPQTVMLKEGWNLVTRVIAGQKRTFFVFGDITPGTFILDPRFPLVANPLGLKFGFTVHGVVIDDSHGSQSIKKEFKGADLLLLPQQTRADGTKFIVLTFTIKDRAGNKTDVKLELTLDPNAPVQQGTGQKVLPPREATPTLLALWQKYFGIKFTV